MDSAKGLDPKGFEDRRVSAARSICVPNLTGEPLKELRARLVQACESEARELMVSGCSHELNNHLTMISHCAELAELTGESHPAEAGWKDVREVCRRALDVVQRLRDQQARTPQRARKARVDETVLRAVKVIRLAAPSGSQFRIEGARDGLVAAFAPALLEELVIHLLLATCECGANSKGVVIHLAAMKDAVRVEVAVETAHEVPTWEAVLGALKLDAVDSSAIRALRIVQLISSLGATVRREPRCGLSFAISTQEG